MKKLTLIIVMAIFIQATASSQSCLPDGIAFTTQLQIDNFQTDYPDCTTIEGDVEITGNDITNLNGLSVVTVLEGELDIGYTTALTNLSGLDNVTSIGETLRLYMNDALSSLLGLDNLTSIGGNFRISNNGALADLSALNNLVSVTENLRVYMNASLLNLSGLDNVVSVGDNLRITNNAVLTSIVALTNLATIGGEMEVDDNDSLTSLAGLENIDAASITEITVRYNYSLSTCEVQSICNYLATPNGDISIHDNAPGCNSQEEVSALCIDGLGENPSAGFNIYPNPAKKEVFISSRYGANLNEVNIYNQIGQKVFGENQISDKIDVSMLRPGIYVIELVSNESKARIKLIVE